MFSGYRRVARDRTGTRTDYTHPTHFPRGGLSNMGSAAVTDGNGTGIPFHSYGHYVYRSARSDELELFTKVDSLESLLYNQQFQSNND